MGVGDTHRIPALTPITTEASGQAGLPDASASFLLLRSLVDPAPLPFAFDGLPDDVPTDCEGPRRYFGFKVGAGVAVGRMIGGGCVGRMWIAGLVAVGRMWSVRGVGVSVGGEAR